MKLSYRVSDVLFPSHYFYFYRVSRCCALTVPRCQKQSEQYQRGSRRFCGAEHFLLWIDTNILVSSNHKSTWKRESIDQKLPTRLIRSCKLQTAAWTTIGIEKMGVRTGEGRTGLDRPFSRCHVRVTYVPPRTFQGWAIRTSKYEILTKLGYIPRWCLHAWARTPTTHTDTPEEYGGVRNCPKECTLVAPNIYLYASRHEIFCRDLEMCYLVNDSQLDWITIDV